MVVVVRFLECGSISLRPGTGFKILLIIATAAAQLGWKPLPARCAHFPPARCNCLSLARALLHRPRVLLLDEPTRSIDAIAVAEFRRFLKTVIQPDGPTSLLFVSHSLPEVELLADRVAVIDAGRLLACDTLSALKLSTGTSLLSRSSASCSWIISTPRWTPSIEASGKRGIPARWSISSSPKHRFPFSSPDQPFIPLLPLHCGSSSTSPGERRFSGFLCAANWLAVPTVLLATLLAFSGLGILSASYLLLFKKGNPAKWFFLGVSSVTMGMLFPVNILPDWLQSVARRNPVTYALGAMRASLLRGTGVAALWRTLAVLLLFAAVLLPLSMIAFAWALRRTKITGTLTHP